MKSPVNPLSIRRRLLALSLSLVLILWLFAIGAVFWQTRHEIEEVFDAHLVQDARVLASLPWDAGPREIHPAWMDEDDGEEEEYHQYEKSITFLVRTRAGELVARTTLAPDLPVYPHFSLRDHHADGVPWRVFTLMENRFMVQTAEPLAVRHEIAFQAMSHVLAVAGLTLPLLALVIGWSVGVSFRPLQRLVADLRRREADQLHPLDPRAAPQEVQPLVNALNQLFQRLETTLENERRFTADAAHELRTPLAGLKTQVEVARNADSAEQRQQALDQMLRGLHRATRLVDQLLTLARVDAQVDSAREAVDLTAMTTDLINEIWPQALAKHLDLGVNNTVECQKSNLHRDHLFLILRNFLDNAARYTPESGKITLHLQQDAGGLRFCVEDNGPGIPPESRASMFARFARGQTPNIHGSGLGLSIAKRIAEIHGWHLILATGTDGKGVAISVELPRDYLDENR